MTAEARHLVVVPHTHWDREWYRTHEQFRYRLVQLVDRLLDLLERDPAFRHFTLDGQAIVVDDYLAVRPEARERIAKLVESGRLLMGPWYVLPDEWLVSGEALIRNLRLGLARARAFGGAMRIGYVPDQFGHIGQLPQIFTGFGFDAAVLWRGVGEDVSETLFRWTAPDGSSLFAVYLPRGYGNAAHLPADPGLLGERLAREARSLGRRSRVPSLLLMNGTDHAEPDPALPRMLSEAVSQLEDTTAEIGSLPLFVDRARFEAPADLPEHRGEFRSGLRAPLLPGCASARMPQKQRDFENDRLLTRYLEPLAAWVGALGGNADPGLIRFIWSVALENHPHDSICGCSVDAVHDQMDARFARVRELAGAHLRRVFDDLAGRMSLPEDLADGPGFAVWNPGAAGRAPVEVEVAVDADPGVRTPLAFHVRDAEGRRLATTVRGVEASQEVMAFRLPARAARAFLTQLGPDFLGYAVRGIRCEPAGAGSGSAASALSVALDLSRSEPRTGDLEALRGELRRALDESGADEVAFAARRPARVRVRFVDDLPGWGMRAYRLFRARVRASDLSQEMLSEGGCVLENSVWRVRVDASGRVSLERRADGRRVDDALRVVSEGDRGDEYNFDPVPDGALIERPARVSVKLEPKSSDCVAVRITGRYRIPSGLTPERNARARTTVELPVELRIRLWTGSDRVDVGVSVKNRARDHRLRLYVRAPFEASDFEVESAFEIARRPIAPQAEGGERVAEQPSGATPQRTFATIAAGKDALTVANRGLAEVEAVPEGDGTTSLAVTLLRAVGWLSRGDLALRPAHAGPPLATPGAQVQGPHEGEISLRWHGAGDAGRVAEAHRFAHPPIATPVRAGARARLPSEAELVRIDDPEVVVSAVEPRPEGRALVRLFNASARERTVQVHWGPGRAELRPVDLCEERGHSDTLTRSLSLSRVGENTRLALRPWQIVSLEVR